MHMTFKRIKVGHKMHAVGAKTQILPGTTLPQGTTIVPCGFNLVFPGVVDGENRYWAGNPVGPVHRDAVPPSQRRRWGSPEDRGSDHEGDDDDDEGAPLLFRL